MIGLFGEVGCWRSICGEGDDFGGDGFFYFVGE